MAKKVTAFVSFVGLSFPAIIAYIIWSSRSLSVTGALLGGLSYLVLLKFIVYPYFFSPLRHVPQPPGAHFAFGHGPATFHPPFHPTLDKWIKTVPNSGLISGRGFFHLSFFSSLLVTTPEAIVEVLNNNAYDYHKPSAVSKFLSRVLGNGLIIVEGKEHKMQRKAVAAAFQGKHIKELAPVFWAKACHFTKTISAELSASEGSKTRQGEVEIGTFTSRCTLDIIGKAGFNRNFNTLDNSDDELARQYETITNPDKGLFVLYFAVNMLFPTWMVRLIPWNMNQKITEATLVIRRISRQMVADRKAELAEEKDSSVDILSVLMRSGELSDDKLVDECLTFMAAGHETTSSAVTWASYLLSANPDIQTRLRDELQAAIPTTAFADPSAVTATLIDSLPLLHGVCNETLRLYPTVPVTSRVAQRDTTILGQFVPQSTEVLVCPWSMNRLESLWGADAAEFRPDRWIGSEKAATLGGASTHYGFMTFLHGPRSCIGQGFARLEMKCLLAALVLKFRMELKYPDEVPVPAGAITIKPKGGMWLRLTEL